MNSWKSDNENREVSMQDSSDDVDLGDDIDHDGDLSDGDGNRENLHDTDD